MAELDRRCQFYKYSDKHQERIIMSFKVANENDAKHCLWRFGVPAGYFVEIHKRSGKIVTNKKILPERPFGSASTKNRFI